MSHNIWFSADYHLWHSNIIKHTNRPFANTKEMNETIISNHNALIKPNDEFYHLGDFCLASPGITTEVLKKLNGKKYFIRGNHDKSLTKKDVPKYYRWLKDMHELTVQDSTAPRGKQLIILCHYAMRTWNKSHWSSWQLFGHSHSKLSDEPGLLSIDVGVDCHNFKPISYEEIKEIMLKKKPTSIITKRDEYETKT